MGVDYTIFVGPYATYSTEVKEYEAKCCTNPSVGGKFCSNCGAKDRKFLVKRPLVDIDPFNKDINPYSKLAVVVNVKDNKTDYSFVPNRTGDGLKSLYLNDRALNDFYMSDLSSLSQEEEIKKFKEFYKEVLDNFTKAYKIDLKYYWGVFIWAS